MQINSKYAKQDKHTNTDKMLPERSTAVRLYKMSFKY